MKFRLVMILAVSSMIAFTACNCSKKDSDKTEEAVPTEQNAKVEYTCPMHPEIVQDNTGQCPKCGMDLEKKEVEVN